MRQYNIYRREYQNERKKVGNVIHDLYSDTILRIRMYIELQIILYKKDLYIEENNTEIHTPITSVGQYNIYNLTKKKDLNLT